MKRFICLIMAISILLAGCAPAKTTQTEISEQPGKYRTLLSPKNKLSIVRKPGAADYSFINPGKMKELPSYDPDLDEIWQIDLSSSDLTELDLSERLNDLLNASFDSKTQWPDKLPDGFDPQMLMELGKNPGLGVRELHKKGVTGKGIGIAIIDQSLLVDHVEYKEQLKLYEEIHCADEEAVIFGPVVASIAVGKTVGVAPEADLYYIAETHGDVKNGEFEWDLSWIAKSIDRIVEINKILPKGEKIRVISISLGVGGKMNGYEQVFDSIEKAKQEGIYTVYVDSDPYFGLGRDPLKSPDDITSFTIGDFWKNQRYENQRLLVPMDYRCTASPTGVDDYVFYKEGGMNWTVPYIAGLYALACQVNPDITPEDFWREAFSTSDTISVDNNSQEKLGKIVNPIKLIEKIGKIK
ncbi:hypothetical protein RBU61_06805 [Tissierella sp. MB52-C2]|uniref:S8 family serine peptidase n=1 Tax=Tissierella sp. MB52-C2 TaxID=3070999 RepID=UPI00280BC87A|nr:S8 family serine peptidase [Tissierella sp. MB52-C2]WMM26376.1 hypothetical protein RBU61_06805 [Tissierella sp. MB52-C2]